MIASQETINSLHQYIAILESQHELSRVPVQTDPILEIAAITNRVCKSPNGGKALLFESPAGSQFQVATNLFGSQQRVCLALGIDHLDKLTEKISALLAQIPAPDMGCLDRQIAGLPEFSHYTPHACSNHDSQMDVMKAPDLRLFPFLQSWPGDGSAGGHPRYITLGQVFTSHPDSSEQNCGMYGAQVRGATELAMRWKAGSGAVRHLESYRRHGQLMPVAIALGGAPATTFSAMFPLPGDLDEITFAGFLGSAPLKTVACRTVPLQVPACCEVIIEGYVHPGETAREGPFGNHTGCYSPAMDASLMRVTAINHRRDAVIPATLVGPPPMEDCWMAQAWERVLLAFLQRLIPDVHELCFPLEWVFHQSAIISLENPDPAMVRETAAKLWNTPWFSNSRLLIFVDATVDIFDMRGVAWRAINFCEFTRDSFNDGTGKCLALDATGCRVPQPRTEQDCFIAERVAKRWREYGLT